MQWVTSIFLLAVLLPQEDPERPGGAAEADQEVRAVLHSLDERLYVPEGLSAVSFSYRPGSRGQPKPAYRVKYSWRLGVGDRIDLLDDQDELLNKVPDVPEAEEQTMRRYFLQTSRQLGEMVRGLRLSEQYSDYRGRVVRRTVNGEEEVSLVLEPRNPKNIRRVTLLLGRDGLPWRWEKLYLNGDQVTQHVSYETREGRFLLSKVQHLQTPGQPQQRGFSFAHLFTYQRVGGLILLATVAKESRDLSADLLGTTELLEMRVNEEVPAFEPLE